MDDVPASVSSAISDWISDCDLADARDRLLLLREDIQDRLNAIDNDLEAQS